MAFDNVKIAQPHVHRLIENSINKNRLSHAYLFEGERGTKKFEMAQYFAMRLLCTSEDKPCGECHNCRRIKHRTHPNVYYIEPIKNTIRKNQIQELQTEFSKTSIEPGPKIYIIRNIEKINLQAANSLLKFLEEPTSTIHAILTTENLNRLLPTIISRSQVVSFTSIPDSVICQELENEGFDTITAKIVSKLTNSTSEAFDIASQDYFIDVLQIVKDLYNIINSKQESSIIYFQENSSIIYQDSEINNLFISLMIMYQKDILKYHTGDIYNIVFTDDIETIKTIAFDKPKNRLIDELEHMLSLKTRMTSYINRSLAYDNLLLSLEKR